MAFSKTLPQICILLTAVYSFVSSQQAGVPGDTTSLFNNLLATSNPQGQPQSDPNTPSFGNMGGSPGFAAPMGQNLGFLGGQPGGFQGRGMPSGFPMGGMVPQAAPAPAPRSSMSNPLMPMMLMSGSDIAQRMALMSMLNGGAGGMGGGAGGMFSNPFMMMSLMNM